MAWLESTALADWVRTSLVGYPLLLTGHSVGMAIMIGLVAVVDLRLIGWFRRIPYTALAGLISIAWYGLIINAFTGSMLFTSQAVAYIASPTYLLKMLMVLGGVLATAYLQPILRQHAASWTTDSMLPQGIKSLAIASLGMWAVAIITGRLTAYL